ncbi:DNA damage-inducible protein 1, partial [Zancudomyces culisetae]
MAISEEKKSMDSMILQQLCNMQRVTMEPEKFNPLEELEPKKWLKRYEMAAINNGWSDENKIEKLENYVVGKARTWYDRMYTSFASWEDTKQKFNEKFAGEEEEYKAWNEMQEIRQEEGEDVESLSIRIDVTARRANICGDKEKIKYLMKAVAPNQRKLVMKSKVKTYEEAVNLLIEEELVDNICFDNRPQTSSKKIEDNGRDRLNIQPSDIETLIDKFNQISSFMLKEMNGSRFRSSHTYNPQEKREYQKPRPHYNGKNRSYGDSHRNNNWEPKDQPQTEMSQGNAKGQARGTTVAEKEINCLEVEPFRSNPNSIDNEVYITEKRKINKNTDSIVEETNRRRKRPNQRIEADLSEEANEVQPSQTVAETEPQQHLNLSPGTNRLGQEQNRANYSNNNSVIKPYSIMEDLAKVKASISIPQLINIAPIVQTQLERFNNRINNERTVGTISNQKTTNCKTNVHIYGKSVPTVIDTGAACSVLATAIADKLGIFPDMDPNEYIITADGSRHMTLGKVSKLPIRLANVEFETEALIMDLPNNVLILGMDWLSKFTAQVDLRTNSLTITKNNNKVMLPLLVSKELNAQTWDNESEDLELFGIGKETKVIKEISTKIDEILEDVIHKYADQLVEEYTELTVTNVLEHSIDTGDAAPIKLKPYRIPNAMKELVRKEIEKDVEWAWTVECEQAVNLIKQKLTTAPILVHPNWDLPFIITTDASITG